MPYYFDMNSSSKQFHMRFIPSGLPAPLKRASDFYTRSFAPDSLSSTASSNRLSFCDEDLVDFDPTEFSAELALNPDLKLLSESDYADFRTLDTYNRAVFVSRWRRLTLRRFSRTLQASAKTASYLTPEQEIRPTPASLSMSRPSSHTAPSSSSSVPTLGRLARSHTKRSTKGTVDVPDRSSILYDSDPFRADSVSSPQIENSNIRATARLPVELEEIIDPNCITPSPPSSCVTTPASITPSSAVSSGGNPLRRSLRRLRTITKNRLSSNHKAAAVVPDEDEGLSTTAVASSVPPPRLPELSFDSTPLALLVSAEYTPDPAVSYHERQDATRLASPLRPSQDTLPPFPLIKWERVDPKDLTPSPYSLNSIDFEPAETPSVVPSPSWLSRNVRDIEPQNAFDLHSQAQPPSPDPLPILPRSLLPVASRFDSPSIVVDSCPPSAQLESPPQESSLTLVSPGLLSVPRSSSRPPSLHRLSVLQYDHPSDRRSIHSVITVAFSSSEQETYLAPTYHKDSGKSRFLLLLHPVQSPPRLSRELTPDPSPLSLSLPVTFGSGIIRSASIPPTPTDFHERYLPSQEAFTESSDTFPLPGHLREIIKNISRSALNTPIMSAGKQMETVDWGEDVDYSGYEWFKDPPPPRPEPEAQPIADTEDYAPPQGVIEQNVMFDYALKSAPNVLNGRFKQYGQLGVLAWCSEFSELVDALKALGFDGNMFISTRTQALKTCEEILKLNLDIKMRIIVMYLNSQVARLRRFLDSGTEFNDYVETDFPLDYTQYRDEHS